MRFTMRWHGEEIPVPYVTLWSSERDVPSVIRPDPLLRNRPAWFEGGGRPGDGVPIVSKMAIGRTRESVVKQLCQLCGKRLGSRRFLVDVWHPMPGPGGLRVNAHPWACASCLVLAYRVCPALLGGVPRVLRVRAHELVETMTTDPNLPPFTEGAATAIGYVRVVPTRFEYLTIDELREAV